MKMFFEEKEVVTIVNYQKGNKEVTRQSIADYLTQDAIEEICEKAEGPYIMIEHEEILEKVREAATIWMYLPFIERITVIPNELVLKIKVTNREEDIKVQVSQELYNFLKELN